MNIYMAPLEGITTYQYRNLHHKYFGGVDKYFTPFLSPGPDQGLSVKEVKDALPENNPDIPLVPQILTARAEDFLNAAKVLGQYGYREINLNLGCPSGTVVAKKKGSGLLYYPEELERFLDAVFSDREVADGTIGVSVKTRIGKHSAEEWPELLRIYNCFPIKELIIHPRVREDYYKNTPNMAAFTESLRESRNPIVYNGDLFTAQDAADFAEKFPGVKTIMLGRGLIRNPALAEEVKAQSGMKTVCQNMTEEEKKRLKSFHDELLAQYCDIMSGDRNVLFKMKEIWSYMSLSFPGHEKTAKKIRKANHMTEYRSAVDEFFSV